VTTVSLVSIIIRSEQFKIITNVYLLGSVLIKM